MQSRKTSNLRVVKDSDSLLETIGILGREKRIILPIVCPSCGGNVGFLNTASGCYVLDGNFCRKCGAPIKENMAKDG